VLQFSIGISIFTPDSMPYPFENPKTTTRPTMKKTPGLLLLFLIFHQQINSQLSNYSFAASSGTYTNITGTPATVSAR